MGWYLFIPPFLKTNTWYVNTKLDNSLRCFLLYSIGILAPVPQYSKTLPYWGTGPLLKDTKFLIVNKPLEHY